MSTYLVKEIFGPTIQGEGVHSGRPCVFLRFAACNLACTWCDTDFSKEGARKLSAESIRNELLERDLHQSRLVIVTGGEPTLWWDEPLATCLKDAGFSVHMESNGIHAPKASVDWLTISPKEQFHRPDQTLSADASPDECKVVIDGPIDVSYLDHLRARYPRCRHWIVQPCDDGNRAGHEKHTLELVTQRPEWRFGVQLHKVVGVP